MMVDEAEAWRAEALCRGADPELFFAEKGVGSTAAAAIVRVVCEPCPVREECLEAGLREQFGFWGGTSPRERRQLRKERGITLREPVVYVCGEMPAYWAHLRNGEEPCQLCRGANAARKVRNAAERRASAA